MQHAALSADDYVDKATFENISSRSTTRGRTRSATCHSRGSPGFHTDDAPLLDRELPQLLSMLDVEIQAAENAIDLMKFRFQNAGKSGKGKFGHSKSGGGPIYVDEIYSSG